MLATLPGSVQIIGSGATERAEDDPDNQRRGRGAQHQSAAAGQRDLDEREQEPDGQAQSQADGVDVAGGALGIAEVRGDLGQSSPRRGHPQSITTLQHEIRGGHDVDVATPDPAHDRVEALLHAQVAQFPADEFGVGQGDAPEVDLAAVHPRFLGGRPAHLGHEPVRDVLAGGDGEQIPGGQRLGVLRDDGPAVARQPRDHRLVAVFEPAHGECGIGDQFQRAHHERRDGLPILRVGLRLPTPIRYEQARMVSNTVMG